MAMLSVALATSWLHGICLPLHDYTSPVLTIVSFYCIQAFGAFTVQQIPSGHSSLKRRRWFLISTSVLIGTYLMLAATAFLSSTKQPASHTFDHAAAAFASSALVWTGIWRQSRTGRKVRWKHITIAASCDLVVRVLHTCFRTSRQRNARMSGHAAMSSSLDAANILALIGLLTLSTTYSMTPVSRTSQKMAAGAKQSGKQSQTFKTWEDQMSDADDEDDGKDGGDDGDGETNEDSLVQREKSFAEKQRARLEEAGDWFTYLKPYKIFLPLILPFEDRKLQAGIAYLMFHLSFTRVLSFLVPRQMGIIADKLITNDLQADFPVFDILFWAALQLLESELCYTIREMVFLPIHSFVYKSVSSTAFRHVMNLSMDFHQNKSSSDVVRTVHQGEDLTQIVSFICFDLSPLVADIFIAMAYITTTFEPYLMLIMLAGGIVNCWLAEDTNKWARKKRKQFIKANQEMSKSQYEALSNWQTVSQFNNNKYECEKHSAGLDDYCKQEREMTIVYNVAGTVRGCFMLAARLAATALIMYRVSQGRIPLGELVTFVSVWDRIMDPIISLSRVSRRMQTLMTDAERLLILLQTKPTVVDKPDAKQFRFKEGVIEFDHVDFAYDPRKATLTDISVKVPAGSTVALVGETGGGKTTLIRMLYRYYDVTGGAVRIDGQDIRDVSLDSLRSIFGLVPQDPALFNTTLLENLRYARLDATDDEIMDACRAACIHDKIMQFPDKYRSKVGERGVKLSGGEMQRVAVARAILRKPKIVLLDEATSMIDAETEHLIQLALRRLTTGRTTFVVAHRLSTIQHADLILVVENGRIIERGSHEELFRKGGKYVKLWSKQMSKHVDLTSTIAPVVAGLDTPPHSD